MSNTPFEVYGECSVFHVVGSKLCSIRITALGEQPDIVEDMSALKENLKLICYRKLTEITNADMSSTMSALKIH